MDSGLIAVLFVIGVIFAFALIMREVFTWWLKINQMVKQNDEIIRLLKKIAGEHNDGGNTFTDQKLIQMSEPKK